MTDEKIHDLYERHRVIVEGINESRINEVPESKMFVALYLYKNRIVSIGMNKSKSHPLLLKFQYDKWFYYMEDNAPKNYKQQFPIHAELDGYIKLLNTNTNFNTLLIYRGYNGTLPSEPCHVCTSWLSKIHKLKVAYIKKYSPISYDFDVCYSYELGGYIRRSHMKYIPNSNCQCGSCRQGNEL